MHQRFPFCREIKGKKEKMNDETYREKKTKSNAFEAS